MKRHHMEKDIPPDSLLRDALTGAYTRAAFEQRLQEEIASAGRFAHPLSLLFLDIDHFKSINDGFGHARGDEVLVETSRRLQSCIRAYDSVFRYGGDEFILLLPRTAMAQAIEVAHRLLRAVDDTQFTGEPPLKLSISVGAATFPVDGSTPAALFSTADQRLNQAKRSGRSQVVDQDTPPAEPAGVDQFSRLIERDQAIETFQVFFSQVLHQTRSALRLSGPKGSGLTRLLEEAGRVAQMVNMAAIHVQGTPALGNRLYGALLEATHSLGALTDPVLGTEAYATALREACRSQPGAADRPFQALVILVDEPAYLDGPSLEFLQRLYFSDLLPPLALVYTDTSDHQFPFLGSLEPQTRVSLTHLTPEGVQIWLRYRLRWEAPAEFVAWLHQHTSGLPAQIQRGIDHLLETRVLQRFQGAWRYQAGYERKQLAEVLAHPLNPPCRLPAGLPLFVGRHADLHSLKQITSRERLVVLAGPGGVGKTRLAIQLAAECLDDFPHGVFFVPLAGLPSTGQLLPAIAEALQLQFSGRRDPRQEFISYLQSRRMLLVMDNFEHLRESADLLVDIMEHTAGVSLLVTSRDPLNLPGESLYELDSLAYPMSDDEVNFESYEAIQLFLRAARQKGPDFTLVEEERRAVARICRLVEGNPLGLELAAAWAGVIPPHQIAAEIEHNLAFLDTHHRESAPRQRSLMAVLDSFWEVLTESEQEVICQLAVFASGFQREAARDVAQVSALFLDALIAKAYLRVDPQGRYQMHEMLRQYATAKLALKPTLVEVTHERHARYYLGWVKRHEGQLEDNLQVRRMISREMDNIRLAWKWATEHDRLDLLNQGLLGLKIYLGGSSRWEEGRQILAPTIQRLRDRAGAARLSPEEAIFWLHLNQAQGNFLKYLARLDEARTILEEVYESWARLGDITGLSQALFELGDVYRFLGNFTASRQSLEKGLVLARDAGNQAVIVDILPILARLMIDQTDYPAALTLLDECLRISRALGRQVKIAQTLNLLGLAATEQGNYPAARPSYSESLAIYQKIGDRLGTTNGLLNQGLVALGSGQLDEAQHYFEDGLFMAREIGLRLMEASCLNNLGMVAYERGDLLTAQTLYEDALKLNQATGHKRGAVNTLDNLGVLALAQKNYAAARIRYREALEQAREIGYKSILPFALAGFACLAAEDEGQFPRAVRLCAAARSYQARHHIALDAAQQRMLEQTREQAGANLSPAVFEAAWDQGQSLSDEQAVALALAAETGTTTPRCKPHDNP